MTSVTEGGYFHQGAAEISAANLIPQKVFIEFFCKSQFPQES
jgi:hypothetical protein